MEQKPSRLRELYDKYHEFILYSVFGIFTTGASWLSYAICEAVFHMNLYYSGIVSWIAAVTVAYITNKIWVFNSKSWKPMVLIKEIISFYGGRGITGIVEILGVPALVSLGVNQTLFGVEGFVAKILITGIIIIVNYVVSKFIVFGKPKSVEENKDDKSE